MRQKRDKFCDRKGGRPSLLRDPAYREKLANLLARPELTYEAIAVEIGVTARTIARHAGALKRLAADPTSQGARRHAERTPESTAEGAA